MTDARIDYVELPSATAHEVTRAFYAKTFGWKFTDFGPDYSATDNGIVDHLLIPVEREDGFFFLGIEVTLGHGAHDVGHALGVAGLHRPGAALRHRAAAAARAAGAEVAGLIHEAVMDRAHGIGGRRRAASRQHHRILGRGGERRQRQEQPQKPDHFDSLGSFGSIARICSSACACTFWRRFATSS